MQSGQRGLLPLSLSSPLSAAERPQVSEHAVPTEAAPHMFQHLRPRKRACSIYEMEERAGVLLGGATLKLLLSTQSGRTCPHTDKD